MYTHKKGCHHLCHHKMQSNDLCIVLPTFQLEVKGRLEGQHRNYDVSEDYAYMYETILPLMNG